jgi:hypothetical protein
MDRLENFLKELSELTNKYGFEIAGCGCCGSPWVSDLKSNTSWDDLCYDIREEKYLIGDSCDEEGGEE